MARQSIRKYHLGDKKNGRFVLDGSEGISCESGGKAVPWDQCLIPISDYLGFATQQTLPLQQINHEYAL